MNTREKPAAAAEAEEAAVQHSHVSGQSKINRLSVTINACMEFRFVREHCTLTEEATVQFGQTLHNTSSLIGCLCAWRSSGIVQAPSPFAPQHRNIYCVLVQSVVLVAITTGVELARVRVSIEKHVLGARSSMMDDEAGTE